MRKHFSYLNIIARLFLAIGAKVRAPPRHPCLFNDSAATRAGLALAREDFQFIEIIAFLAGRILKRLEGGAAMFDGFSQDLAGLLGQLLCLPSA